MGRVTCDVCGSPLILLPTGAAVCSTAIKPGAEMHGKAFVPTPEQAKWIKWVWKYKDLPEARVVSQVVAKYPSPGHYYTKDIYIIQGQPGLYRRVRRTSREVAILAKTEQSLIGLVRWLEAEIELGITHKPSPDLKEDPLS